MPHPLRIMGQGLAGSLLAWECERAGIPFEVVDVASGSAASHVAAGILNPITGQRVVKSWRVDELLPLVVGSYRRMEAELGESLLFPMRIWRIFRDEREREIASEKLGRGELQPYVEALEQEGFWIRSAYYLDTHKLVKCLRRRWIARGLISTRPQELSESRSEERRTIWCVGAGELSRDTFAFTRMQPAKGQILTIRVEGIEPGVVLNDGHWVLPISGDSARVGATYERGETDLLPTPEARVMLERAACRLLKRVVTTTGHDVGIRMTSTDKHPILGWHPHDPQCGVINGLGSKGGLLAPWLAHLWIDHLVRGVSFDHAVDVRRFAPC